jgi:hypothetical protein
MSSLTSITNLVRTIKKPKTLDLSEKREVYNLSHLLDEFAGHLCGLKKSKIDLFSHYLLKTQKGKLILAHVLELLGGTFFFFLFYCFSCSKKKFATLATLQ